MLRNCTQSAAGWLVGADLYGLNVFVMVNTEVGVDFFHLFTFVEITFSNKCMF